MAENTGQRRILITTDAVGGVWTYSLDLARELAKAGVHCVVSVLGPPPGDQALQAARSIPGVEIVTTGLPLDWLANGSAEVLDAGRKLAELARTLGCDTVQLHTPALAAAGSFTQPVISVHHSCPATWWLAVRRDEPLPDDLRWRSALVARGIVESAVVISPTTAHGQAVAEAYGLVQTPHTIRNGRSSPPEAADRAVTDREPFVLTSGRLWDVGKNTALLDRVAAKLAVPVLAAGSVKGPSGEATAFRSLRHLGPVTEVEMRRWLAAAPIYVSAARYEPFGLGVLEAAQAGCALVLSDMASFRELWSGACLFVAPGDEEGFAEAIRRLLADPPLLRRMSSRAASRARHYSAAGMAVQMLRLHEGILAQSVISNGAAA